MNRMAVPQVLKVDVSLKTMLWLLLALSTVRAQDVYDLCSVRGTYEVIVQDVLESLPVGSVVETMNFNGNQEQVEVQATTSSAYLSYNESSREIILISELDAESTDTPDTFKLSCKLTSSSGPKIPITVRILIKDVNDNPPVFTQEQYYIDIRETESIGSRIITHVRATDRDEETGSNGLVYYSLLNDTYSTFFDIKNPLQSNLTLEKMLDYESAPFMTVRIIAKDQPNAGQTQMTATTTLHINVVDMDDLPPVFDEASYEGTVPEYSPQGTVVNLTKAISATDQDISINASIKYSIKKATTDYFAIDPDTAEVYVNNPPPAQELSIMIEATQVDNQFRTDTTFLKIIVSANNSNPPTFQESSYKASVPESLPLGSTVLTVTATDRDFGTKISYYFVAQEEIFTINRNSGVIKLRQALDFETATVYIFKVAASDGQFNATTTVTVQVSDVNDNNPVITPSQFTVNSVREKGRYITDIEAVDYDANTQLRYSLASHSSLFSINSDGQLRIAAESDNLTENQYDVVVIVTDNGVPSRQSSAVVTVIFPPLNPTIGGVTMPAQGSDVLSICLGVVAAILLIIVIILTVYIIRRRLRSSEQLDKAKNRHTMDPRGILFKKHPGSRAPSRAALNFTNDPDESLDGCTTVAENPFSMDGNSNYGYVHSDESETDRDIDEIQIETAVIPYRNGHKFPSNGDIYEHMEDEDGLPVTKLDHSYQNGSLSTFKDSNSNESLHSDSTNSKRGLMKNMNGIATKSLPMKKLSWAGGNGGTPSNRSLNSLDQDTGISPIDEKPEITVYF